MSETANFRLPLVLAAQAQKHVTVNEALVRLDALGQTRLASRSQTIPPVSVSDGALYGVPVGASGAWAGKEGRIALWLNGGWEFVTPQVGWRSWIADEATPAVFDGATWAAGVAAVSQGGAGLSFRVIEADHAIGTGAESVTAALIPSGALVFGVTGRVVQGFGGTATAFRVGIGGEAPDRYGSGIGTGAGAWFRGVTGTPVAYYADTALTIAAEGGAFDGGLLRIAIHIAELGLPRA